MDENGKKRVYLITHTDLDGVSCAVLAKKYFGYYADDFVLSIWYMNYDEIDTFFKEEILSEKLPIPERIYITDISVSDDTAIALDNYAETNGVLLRLLDHHGTATRLNIYSWATVLTNLTPTEHACGTFLFFRELYFDPDFTPGEVLEYVELVRLWDTFDYKHNEALGQKARDLNYLFSNSGRESFINNMINNYLTDTYKVFPEFSEADAETIILAKDKEEKVYEAAKENLIRMNYDGRDIGVYFGSAYTSQVANRLCEDFHELDYICCINMQYGTMSFRTIREDLNLGTEVASKFGGGGHPKASGATLSKEFITKMAMMVFNQ